MTSLTPPSFDIEDVTIRLAEDHDHAEIADLFHVTTLTGPPRNNDTGADIANLREGYFADDGASGFWVASHGGTVIGMIGVQSTGENTAELRRLRVREEFRGAGIGRRLLEHAIEFCRERDYLKITLDVRTERGPAIALIEKMGFVLSRRRKVGEYKIADFYLDLYTEPEI
jgi:ribosomal protein S18 acetylase RimI-like enzyme